MTCRRQVWVEIAHAFDSRERESQRRESNPRPIAYEAIALPLSYAGMKFVFDFLSARRGEIIPARWSAWQEIDAEG